MNKLSVLFLFFIYPLAAVAQMPVDSITDENPYFLLMGEADRAIAAEDWPEAIARLNDVLIVGPDNPSNALVYYNLGVCYGCVGSDSLSLQAYDNSLAMAPNMLLSLVGRGRQRLKMNLDLDAFDDFDAALHVDSLSTEARFYHGMMALYGGNRAVAEADFKVLLDVAPYTADTAIALSTLYSLTGRERDAVPYLKQLIEEDPQAEYYASLAGCYLAMQDFTEASAILHVALEKYPADGELYYYRAWLNRDTYRLDDARADGRRAISLGASPAKVKALFSRDRK